jgi:hypothetical protein
MRKKAIVIIFFILLFNFNSPGLVYGAVPANEREALIALYNGTDGDRWDNNSGWKTDGDFSPPGTEKDWYGITVSNDHVTGINLSDNSLNGSIPGELGDLSNLVTLDLHSNQLKGSIPPGVGKLANLITLDLHYNQITGIPLELEDLSNLRYLYLDRNQITGIPPGLEWENLSKLQHLYLYSNLLNGSIPPDLCNLANLERLYLNDNSLIGIIPQELGKLSKLTRLYLHANGLSGEIPTQLGLLANLQHLYLNSNRLTGRLPDSLENLDSLVENGIDLRWNALYTDNESLRDFLNTKQDGGDWESTQTTAPTNTTAQSTGSTSIKVGWHPIQYTGDTGGYRVFYSPTPGGPYTLSGTTEDKTVSWLDVTGLSKNTAYYLVVNTQTGPHANNQNTVESEYSEEMSATTSEAITISGRVTISTGTGIPGLSGVTITFSSPNGGTKTVITSAEGYYSHTVDLGWTGTGTPAKTGYSFNPVSIPYNNVTSDRSNQDYTAFADWPIISGKVKDLEGIGVPGVTMTFAGSGESTVTQTDSSGIYSLGVEKGWTGTVTPSKNGYTFNPTIKSYVEVTLSYQDEDYTASVFYPVISGAVVDAVGNPLSVVTLTFSPNGGSAVTGVDGNYNHEVNFGWTGTVTPQKNGYEFVPGNRLYPPVTTCYTNENYEATAILPIISGRTANSEGIGVAGVTLTFSGSEESTSTTTDSDGIYRHGVPGGWTGTVTPSKRGYYFSPPNMTYENVTGDRSRDYTATAILPVISGRIADSSGRGIEGSILDFSNGAEDTSTGPEGYYNNTVEYGWTGTVVPKKDGFEFNPGDRPYENVTTDWAGEDYEAIAIYYVISGKITIENGEGLLGVKVNFSNGVAAVETDSEGNYSQQVPYGWRGEVEPGKYGYKFNPTSHSYKMINTDTSGNNFNASAVFPVISGRVSDSKEGVEDVIMIFESLSGETDDKTKTDNEGYYKHAVTYGWSGTVTARKYGYTIIAVGHTGEYRNVITDKTNRDYNATPITPKISGKVTDAKGKWIKGVTITFAADSGETAPVQTDDDGYYQYNVKYDWSGTVTPKKDDWLFDPPNNYYSQLTESQFHQDFKLKVTLTLTASCHEESTLIMVMYYGEINIEVILEGFPLPDVEKYILMRKEFGGDYKNIKDFTPQKDNAVEVIEYVDKYLDSGVFYTYIVKAYDANNKEIGVSNEKTIQPGH